LLDFVLARLVARLSLASSRLAQHFDERVLGETCVATGGLDRRVAEKGLQEPALGVLVFGAVVGERSRTGVGAGVSLPAVQREEQDRESRRASVVARAYAAVRIRGLVIGCALADEVRAAWRGGTG
jgi:hypothetical protein